MSLTSLVLSRAASTPKPEDFERFLFIGPHPDDIEIGAGATAAKLSAMGKKVSFLICTDGRYGLENAPKGTTPEELISIRQKEARGSAGLLGVTDLIFLGFSDGGFYDPKELFSAIAVQIGERKPEVIFAPDPFVSNECHVDHLQVGEAVRRLAFLAPFREIMEGYGAKPADVKALAFYMTAKPNRYVQVRKWRERQIAALRCHKSQFPAGSQELRAVELYGKLRALDFGVRSLTGCAEGFRVLGKTQMHCLPEAGE